ncbi:autotransporter outer membrane beta-barrel domain-containing protein [Bartonella sp. B30(2025)]
MSKNYLPLCTFTTVILFFITDVNTNAQPSKKTASQCNNNNDLPYRCSDGQEHTISSKTYTLFGSGQGSEDVAVIEASKKNTKIDANNITVTVNPAMRKNGDLEKNSLNYGVKVSEEATVNLNSSLLKNVPVGVNAEYSTVKMEKVLIDATRVGVSATGKGSSTTLEDITIKTDSNGISLLSMSGANIMMKGGEIGFKNGIGVQIGGDDGKISLYNISVTDNGSSGANIEKSHKNAALHMLQGQGVIDFQNGKIEVKDAHGLFLEGNNNNSANIKNSHILVEGNQSYGMNFLWQAMLNGQQKIMLGKGAVNLEATTLAVPNSTAIYSKRFDNSITLSKNSTVWGSVLLNATDKSSVNLVVNSSIIQGKTYVDDSSTAKIKLENKSKWILSEPERKQFKSAEVSKPFSSMPSISELHLKDSSLFFKDPESKAAYNYQDLRIGEGQGVVYQAEGDTHLYLNTYLGKESDAKSIKTDRLFIDGDVSGKTIVHVKITSEGRGREVGKDRSDPGISLIQVSGNASEDSFKLQDGYVTLGGTPYQYDLVAYNKRSYWDFCLKSKLMAPTSRVIINPVIESNSNGVESEIVSPAVDAGSTFVTPIAPVMPESGSTFVTPSVPIAPEADPFIIPPDSAETSHYAPDVISAISTSVVPESHSSDTSSVKPNIESISKPVSHSQQYIRAVVPQVPAYLLLPNSLFQAGLLDIINQNKQLEAVRAAPNRLLKTDENPALFFRGYGGIYHYASNLSEIEYGYDGDLDYKAFEAGILLQKIENKFITTSFGVMGTYGKFSFEPQNVEQSQQSTFDKWAIAVYGGVEHDVGFYIDGFLSYGLFNGDVFTFARGKTATLNGRPFSGSLTAGKVFTTKCKNLVFDPQIQVIYQRLQFNKAHDIDGFDIDMKKSDQWMMRFGGRLTKTISVIGDSRVISFYGKVHFVNDFSYKQFVYFKDSFELGAFGSSLEAGFGIHSQLSPNMTFHSDVVYQRKLAKAGFSGTHFSGGLSYRF